MASIKLWILLVLVCISICPTTIADRNCKHAWNLYQEEHAVKLTEVCHGAPEHANTEFWGDCCTHYLGLKCVERLIPQCEAKVEDTIKSLEEHDLCENVEVDHCGSVPHHANENAGDSSVSKEHNDAKPMGRQANPPTGGGKQPNQPVKPPTGGGKQPNQPVKPPTGGGKQPNQPVKPPTGGGKQPNQPVKPPTGGGKQPKQPVKPPKKENDTGADEPPKNDTRAEEPGKNNTGAEEPPKNGTTVEGGEAGSSNETDNTPPGTSPVATTEHGDQSTARTTKKPGHEKLEEDDHSASFPFGSTIAIQIGCVFASIILFVF